MKEEEIEGSKDELKDTKKTQAKSSSRRAKKENIEKKPDENLEEITKLEEDNNVPDWLKGSLPDMPDADLESAESSKEEKKSDSDEKQPEKKAPKKRWTRAKTAKKTKQWDVEDKKEVEAQSGEKKSPWEELWDDGMKIPDWLKTDDDDK